MRVVINGEAREVPEGLNLRSLIQHLSLPHQRMAVEVDKQVIRKADWALMRNGMVAGWAEVQSSVGFSELIIFNVDHEPL